MSSTRKRRTRSPHPGIVLLRPDPAGRHPNWRARYADPDSGRMVKTTLDPTGLPTAETRRDWAIKKARSIAKRRMDLESGANRATGTSLDDALKRYWEDHPKLRERTLEIYRRSAAKLQAWAKRSGIRSADDVRGPQLVAFRAELTREPRRVHALGGKRGQQRKTKEPRSASTINIELRAIRTILGYLRRLGLLPHIDTDDLKDGLERLAVSHERGNFLKPHELQKLLEAALRHDAETFAATREEHAGEREPGTTSRYEPIAPIVACALLTGMRFGEVMALEWKQVDLDALGSDGEVVGEINLTAATKTKRARTVGLEVSPALRRLLAAMQLKAGTKRTVFASTRDTAEAAAKRIRREYGAPAGFTWQTLRRTCGCFLTNAPGIFGAASAYRSAKQLGHSVSVAEKHYVDVVRGIPREARTLEAAMQIEAQMTKVIAAVGTAPAKARKIG